MTISIRLSFVKRHRVNVTRVFDVNERRHDALHSGTDD